MSDKTCKNCNQTKPKTEFTGKYSMCKPCRAKDERENYAIKKQQQSQQALSSSADMSSSAELPEIPTKHCDICDTDVQEFQTDICPSCIKIEQRLLKRPIKDINTYVYLITCPLFLAKHRYKIGMHTGDLNKLHQRYCTAFPDLQVVRFQKTSNARFHEHELHKKCKLFRVKNSEWFESVEVPNLFDSYFMDNVDPQYTKILSSSKHLLQTIINKKYNEIPSVMEELIASYNLIKNDSEETLNNKN